MIRIYSNNRLMICFVFIFFVFLRFCKGEKSYLRQQSPQPKPQHQNKKKFNEFKIFFFKFKNSIKKIFKKHHLYTINNQSGKKNKNNPNRIKLNSLTLHKATRKTYVLN